MGITFAHCSRDENQELQTERTPFEVPSHFPEPAYSFENNPISLAGVELGRKLFYEPALSLDSTISCASCHQQQHGFSDLGQSVSQGVFQRIGTRNSPSLSNLAWNKSFMWDGGINHIEIMPLGPIEQEKEMSSNLNLIAARLNNSATYRSDFKTVFNTDSITSPVFFRALAQFLSSMVSDQSKYDQFLNEKVDFSTLEMDGYNLFKANCSSCHAEPLTTNFSFENNGTFIKNPADSGRYRITLQAEDIGKFKVPSLRNVMVTAPYMHNGAFETIDDVLNHYSFDLEQAPHRSAALADNMNFTLEERNAIKAFLQTLTDYEYLNNEKLSNPFLNND
jgi:cytochrome c peroxidase